MGGTTGLSLRWIPVGRQNDFGSKLTGALDCGVEVPDLKPQQNSVAVRPSLGIAHGTVVMVDIPSVQLEDQLALDGQPLVLRTTVLALAPE